MLDPTEALRKEMARTPTLEVAAFIPGRGDALPDRRKGLPSRFRASPDLRTRGGFDFSLEESNSGAFEGRFSQQTTQFGSFNIAIYGFKFKVTDFFRIIYEATRSEFQFLAPVWFTSLLAAWLSLRQGLKPLQAAAIDAQRIDLHSLDEPIASSNLPREIAPFVEKINEALSRLDGASKRQSRFFANCAHEPARP